MQLDYSAPLVNEDNTPGISQKCPGVNQVAQSIKKKMKHLSALHVSRFSLCSGWMWILTWWTINPLVYGFPFGKMQRATGEIFQSDGPLAQKI